eukprot:2807954-Rhodomonas_salina.2
MASQRMSRPSRLISRLVIIASGMVSSQRVRYRTCLLWWLRLHQTREIAIESESAWGCTQVQSFLLWRTAFRFSCSAARCKAWEPRARTQLRCAGDATQLITTLTWVKAASTTRQ